MNQAVQSQENKGTSKNPKWVSKFDGFADFYDEELMFGLLFNPEKIQQAEKKKKAKVLSLADKNRLLSKVREEEQNG